MPYILPILDKYPDARACVVKGLELAKEQDEANKDRDALPFILIALDKYPDVKDEVMKALRGCEERSLLPY
jgi:hypothetical protein